MAIDLPKSLHHWGNRWLWQRTIAVVDFPLRKIPLGHHPIEVGMAAHDVNSQDYNTSIPSLVDIQRYP